MRVAQRMVTRNYLKSLNSAAGKRASSLEKQASGLKFNRLSENVSAGARAMRIQEERLKSQSALETVEGILLDYNSVDSNMDAIDSSLQTLQEKVLAAMSDGHGQEKRDVLALEIGKIKEQVLQFVNSQFGGQYLFGGTNNAGPAFDFDANGDATFNGIAIKDIYKDGGKYYYNAIAGDPTSKTLVPDSGDVYMDIGLGMKINGGVTDPRTAFKVSFDSLQMMGFGADGVGDQHSTAVSSNVLDLLTQLESAVSLGNFDAMDDLHGQLVSLNDNMRMSRTELGTRVNYLERTGERLELDVDNLSEMESNLISIDPAEEAINMKMYEYLWMATLQLGSQVLPTSLLDFLR